MPAGSGPDSSQRSKSGGALLWPLSTARKVRARKCRCHGRRHAVPAHPYLGPAAQWDAGERRWVLGGLLAVRKKQRRVGDFLKLVGLRKAMCPVQFLRLEHPRTLTASSRYRRPALFAQQGSGYRPPEPLSAPR
ncbi:hypothetical protein Aave_2125 [Paracidovorax citrulli AAC00-1]|uniref:Uncharacterized protein n=1 Tax=Paracidovorax citrulli (strain AAC00-1) TaxID=397945 RepID=A1TP18_PARC0|nr:hypothetical protein Aave_2125 [Paracidovorax citrulli AAC00-1]